MSWRVAVFLVVGLLSAGASSALGQTWAKTYDGAAGEAPLALAEGAGGELLVAAWTDSFGTATARLAKGV